MGSYNLSCAFSGAPIRTGNPVRVMLIAMNPASASGNLRTHITNLWAPLSFPIPAFYADCGGFIAASDRDWRLTDWIRGMTSLEEEGSFPGQGIAQDTPLKELTKRAIGGEMRVPANAISGHNHTPASVPVGVMAIHAQAYDALAESFDDCGDLITAQSLAAQAPKLLSWIGEVADEIALRAKTFPQDPYLHWFFEGTSTSCSPAVFGLRNAPSPTNVKYRIQHLMKSIATAEGSVADDIEALCEIELETIYRAIGEMIAMQHNMEALSIPFAPSPVASNDYNRRLHAKLDRVAQQRWSAQ